MIDTSMELGSVFLILALFLFVAHIVSRPLLASDRASPALELDRENHELSSLLAERDRILRALQELDIDFNMGKIPKEIYSSQRSFLVATGAEVLQKLESLQTEPERKNAISELRDKNIPETFPDDDLEVMLANRRRIRQEKSAGFCSKCGAPVLKTDHFCPGCGAKVG